MDPLLNNLTSSTITVTDSLLVLVLQSTDSVTNIMMLTYYLTVVFVAKFEF